MLHSRDRILTTHVGSLPRSALLSDLLVRREAGEAIDREQLASKIDRAVADVVARQAEAGIDISNDGEQPRVGFQTYVPQRMAGFGGESQRPINRELKEFPEIVEMQRLRFPRRGRNRNAPAAIGEVRYLDTGPVEADIARVKTAAAGRFAETFMTAASPGIIATTLINQYYDSDESYLAALAHEMRKEYRAIHEGGLLLQIDAPDLAMGRHTMYRNRSVEEFLSLAALHIEVLNEALRNVPADRVRMHVCWGNYEGPHHHDVPMDLLWPVISRVKAQGLLFEGANPRHAHEWTVFREQKVPEDKVLIPGVIGSTSNYIEHPALVAERICRYADLVGRERVIAGSDCGFSTFAGFGPVDPDIAYLKLRSLVEGAELARGRLWRS